MAEDLNISSEDEEKKKSSSTTKTGLKVGEELFAGLSKDTNVKAEKIAETSLLDKLMRRDGSDKAGKDPLSKEDVAETEDNPEESVAEAAPEAADVEANEEANDPEVENLTTGEMAEVRKQTALEEATRLRTEAKADEEPQEAEAREKAIEYLDSVAAEAEVTPMDVVPDVEASEESTPVVNSEVTSEAVAEAGPVEALDDAESVEPEEGPAEFEHEQTIVLNAPERAPEVPEADDEDEPDPVQPSTTTTQGSTTPPTPPTPINPGSPGGSSGSASFNSAPLQGYNPNTNTTINIENNNFYQENGGAYLLAGGILGYMLGRRRGRIKTERRMNAVSKKLEKQIADVREDVVRQSNIIRQQARQNYNLTHAPRGSETTAAHTVNPGRRAETVTELTATQVSVNRHQAAERLGMTQAEASVTAERVQRMDQREVMAIAEKITVDGTSLKTIYEAKQITEPGLRRITREFLRGGDVKAALVHEVKVKEMQYERDPQMRDRLAASYAGVEAAEPQASKEAMSTLLAQGAQPKPYQMQHTINQAEEDAQKAKERGHKVLVGAWAAFVFVLVITAVILAAR